MKTKGDTYSPLTDCEQNQLAHCPMDLFEHRWKEGEVNEAVAMSCHHRHLVCRLYFAFIFWFFLVFVWFFLCLSGFFWCLSGFFWCSSGVRLLFAFIFGCLSGFRSASFPDRLVTFVRPDSFFFSSLFHLVHWTRSNTNTIHNIPCLCHTSLLIPPFFYYLYSSFVLYHGL